MPGPYGAWLFALAPVALAAALWWRFGKYRRIRWHRLAIYVVVLTAILYAALRFVAYVATAVLPYQEVLIVLWFTLSWRLAWELWNRTTGCCGEKYVRWRRWRIIRKQPFPRVIAWIPVARAALTALVFVPAFLATVLTYRCKLRDGQNPRSVYHVDFEPVRIPTGDGLTLDGWFIPRSGADRTIVVCHGAGANKGNFIWFLGPLLNHGYNVVFFDFRAHGSSEGRVTTWGVLERRDVIAVVDWLKHTRAGQARIIVALGSSQGSHAVALAAAEDDRIDAIVLDSPFVSPRELGHHHAACVPVVGPLLVDLVLWEMSLQSGGDLLHASAEQAIASMAPRPVMIIRGKGDIGMPREHAERLYAAARGPRAIWHGPGPHSNIVTTDPAAYEKQLFRFLDAQFGAVVASGLDTFHHDDGQRAEQEDRQPGRQCLHEGIIAAGPHASDELLADE